MGQFQEPSNAVGATGSSSSPFHRPSAAVSLESSSSLSDTLQDNLPDPSPPTLSDFQEIFSYHPPLLRMHPTKHKRSKNTRAPGHYDRHLRKDLRLKRVVFAPSIIDDLNEIADNAVTAALQAGRLPAGLNQLTEELFDAIRAEKKTIMLDEGTVGRFYESTTAAYLPKVASTLEFGNPSWSAGSLFWTQVSPSTKAVAVADGFLTLDLSQEPGTESDDLADIAKMFPSLAVWEFKSVLAGSKRVFDAIVAFSMTGEDFPWTGCEHGDDCRYKHAGNEVTGDKMGFDAHPVCTTVDSVECPRVEGLKDAAQDWKNALHIIQQV